MAKRIKQSLRDEFPFIKLYREDLETIVGLLGEIQAKNIITGEIIELEFISDGFEFKSLDEIEDQLGKEPEYLEFIHGSLGNHNIRLLKKGHATVSFSGHNEEATYFKIKEFLVSKENKNLKIILHPFFTVGLPLIILVSVPWIFSSNYYPTLGAIIMGLAFFSMIFIFPSLRDRLSCSFTLHKKHKGSFWKRNKDELYKMSVSHFVALILGVALGVFVTTLMK